MRFTNIIAFLPDLARELGGIEEAIFYQQMHFWGDKGNREDGFIYKTIEQIEEETTLTRRQQDRVRRKLLEKGWIEIMKTHAPNGKPTLHYRCLVDISIGTKRSKPFVQKGQMDLYKRDKTNSTKGTNGPYTEITTEITTDTNTPSAQQSSAEERVVVNGNSPMDLQIAEVIYRFKTANPSYQRLFMQKPQREATTRLLIQFGFNKLTAMVDFLKVSNGSKFAPTITTPNQMESKLGELKIWADRQRTGGKTGKGLVDANQPQNV